MNRLTVMLLAVAAAIGLWITWATFPLWMQARLPAATTEKLGQWGDSFGSLSALFAALGFIGVLYTIRLQAKEIADQQAEIDRQNARFVRSETEADLQKFESSFFQLFDLFRELRDKTTFAFHVDDKPKEGRQAFEWASINLTNLILNNFQNHGAPRDPEDLVRSIYKTYIHSKAEGSFGPYFRILYTILKRVSQKASLSEADKVQYGNLVRSQLSSAEVSLIAANGLTEAANDFREYVIEFRLLKYLPESQYKTLLRDVYPSEAFDGRND